MDVLYVSGSTPTRRASPRLGARILGLGLLALLAGLLVGWGQHGGLVEAVLHLWYRHVLPAFYTLHAGGLTFCF